MVSRIQDVTGSGGPGPRAIHVGHRFYVLEQRRRSRGMNYHSGPRRLKWFRRPCPPAREDLFPPAVAPSPGAAPPSRSYPTLVSRPNPWGNSPRHSSPSSSGTRGLGDLQNSRERHTQPASSTSSPSGSSSSGSGSAVRVPTPIHTRKKIPTGGSPIHKPATTSHCHAGYASRS